MSILFSFLSTAAVTGTNECTCHEVTQRYPDREDPISPCVRRFLWIRIAHSETVAVRAHIISAMRPRNVLASALGALALALLALASATGGHAPRFATPADAAAPATSGFLSGLRYIGRDGATGAPAPVDDRFIAETERAVERYGKDEQEPEPPPPPGALDIRALAIPKLGVNAPVTRLGLDNFGRLDVPQDTRTVGWNPAYNALPGDGGGTFFAAHFEYAGRPGVFNRISTLTSGDEIIVTLSDGSQHRYRVSSVIDYKIAQIDMGAVLFGREGVESITLMTCSGPPNADGYPMRTVVLAEKAD